MFYRLQFALRILTICLLITPLLSQSNVQNTKAFNNAILTMDTSNPLPIQIRFSKDSPLTLESFWSAFSEEYNLAKENTFRSFKTATDKLGQTHHRFKQYYKGLELADIQYIVHEKDGLVKSANGQVVKGLNMKTEPTLNEQEALQKALNHLSAEKYMWQNKKNEGVLKREKNDPGASYYPKGQLMLSAAGDRNKAENYRLVYRFDIWAEKPMMRYNVDVDAHSGDIVNKISLIDEKDVQGEGQTLYNGMVQITVSDSIYPGVPEPVEHWHLTRWNAYGNEGSSFWIADSTFGDHGGYSDLWYEVLDTDTIKLTGDSLRLSFYHRYKVEDPQEYEDYDAFDGMNVRISVDSGKTWQILKNPSQPYSNTSLYSFGNAHGEGLNIPGWTGENNNWTKVSFDLSAFVDQVVKIRFAFASDEGISTEFSNPEFFGWQVDEIIVSNSETDLYHNNGDTTSVRFINTVKEVTEIAGNYRLREESRGNIFTFNGNNSFSTTLAHDFTDDDSSFVESDDQVGVSAHWALENTYDYFLSEHDRDSYDGSGARIRAYVHRGVEWFNAQWVGSFMQFGDGDGVNVGPLVSLDIVGHEFTHGVTQESAGLIYQSEYGALNESFSDIFGEAIERYASGSVDWLGGDDIVLSSLSVRSLFDPNSRQHPDTYQGKFWRDPFNLNFDFGGVHVNSSVQNHWFYLLVEGGAGVNDNGYEYNVTGIGFEDAEQIAYRNLAVYLTPLSEFHDARIGAINAASDLFGENSIQEIAVKEAWNAVGVYPSWAFAVQNPEISGTFFKPGIDNVSINSSTINPAGIDIDVQAIIKSFDFSYSDTIAMVDDGTHSDTTANDGIYSALWSVPDISAFFDVDIKAFNADSGFTSYKTGVLKFTTVGPVSVNSYKVTSNDTIPNPGDRGIRININLKNESVQDSVYNVSAKIRILDSCATAVAFKDPFYRNIAPESVAEPDRGFIFTFATDCQAPFQSPFALDIYSDEYLFWSDTFYVHVDSTVTALTAHKAGLPAKFALDPNYPNPFNPTTTISYQLPQTSEVELSIYNLLGQKVATLVNKKQKAGYYNTTWDAANFPSGVYVYQIKTDSGYQKSRKLILLK